jgi:putative ABC transport system permease protein
MFKIALKSILARKRRLFTTSIAILLGVAFIAGTAVLSDVLSRSVKELVNDAYQGIDVVVRDNRAQDNVFSSQPIRPPIDESLVGLFAQAKGVRVAEPVVTTQPTLLDKKGKRVSNFGPPTFAFNWIDDPALAGGVMRTGVPPKHDDEAAIDFKTAKEYGWKLGDSITAQFTTGAATFRIVGIGGIGARGDKSTGSRVVMLTLHRLQELTDQVGKIDAINIAAQPGVSQVELRDTLRRIAPPHLQVITGRQFIAETQAQIQQLLDIVTRLVSAFGFIAAFVAIFVIYNTFSIIVAQRTREMALLRAVGAGRAQLLGSVVLEALLIGLIAAGLGLLAGFGLATGLKALLGTFVTVTSGLPHLTTAAVVQSLLVGVLVSVLSALVPAVRATRIPPVAAMAEVSVDHSALSIWRKAFGSLFLLGGIALVIWGVRDHSLSQPLAVVGAGAAIVFVSLLVVGPVFAGGVARLIGWPFQWFGTSGRLARQNAARNPKRTTATAVALTIGVALVVVIGVIAASFKGTFSSLYGSQIRADLIVDSGSQGGGGFPTSVKDTISKVPGVTTVASSRYFGGCVLNSKAGKAAAADASAPKDQGCTGTSAGVESPRGEQVLILGIDTPAIFDIYDIGTIRPSRSALRDDTLMVSKTALDENGWKLGDTVDIRFTETRHFKIAATFDEAFAQGAYFVNLATFDEIAPPALRVDNNLFVRVDPDTPIPTVQDRIKRAIRTTAPAATVEDLGTYVREQTQQLEGFLNLVYAMLLLAIVVAVIGIYNTLYLSVFERTREIGLLRAVGMGRRQVRRMVRWEAIIVALFGTAMGVVAGVLLAIAAVSGFADQGVVLTLPWTQIVIYAVGGAIAGVLAAVFPARTAARTDVLDAISTI